MTGAYELPKLVKEHETYATCWVASQSKFNLSFIKESKISLFDAVKGLCMRTQEKWQKIIVRSHRAQLN